jgi:hypothetical protein
MPRKVSRATAEEVILQAVEDVVERASAGIARAISDILAARIDEELKAQVARAGARARAPDGARPAPSSASGWRTGVPAGFPTSSSSRPD